MKNTSGILILVIILMAFGCRENVIDIIGDNNNYGPLDVVEHSIGNIWNKLTVLPDTGNAIHFVTTWDAAINDSGYIFVATDFPGVFRSKNDGISWTAQNNGIKHKDDDGYDISYLTTAVGALGNSTFVGTDSAIYVSQNFGDTWNTSISWMDYKLACVFKPKNKGELYAGCYHSIMKTNDFGKTWKDISANFSWTGKGYAYDLKFTNDGTLYVATAKGLARTIDDGKTWEYFGIQDQTQCVEISVKGYIFAAIFNQLYVSKDNGKTWDSIFSNDIYNIELVLINHSNIIFLCCSNGVYRSKDDGKTWEELGFKKLWPRKIFYDHRGRLIVATGRKGIYISPE